LDIGPTSRLTIDVEIPPEQLANIGIVSCGPEVVVGAVVVVGGSVVVGASVVVVVVVVVSVVVGGSVVVGASVVVVVVVVVVVGSVTVNDVSSFTAPYVAVISAEPAATPVTLTVAES
jgi:hypothetical protein